MANENVRAKSVYEDICSYFDSKSWKYKRHDDDLVLTYTVTGDDLDMDFIMVVYDNRELIKIVSRMPVAVPEDKRIEGATAVCAVNYGLSDGFFTFNLADGKIDFNLVLAYMGSELTNEAFEYLVAYSQFVVDEYNDKFFAFAKGYMGLEDFIKNK